MSADRVFDYQVEPVQLQAAGEHPALVPGANQWHLGNSGQGGGKAGIDLNIKSAWQDYRGSGVSVLVVDEAVDGSVTALQRDGQSIRVIGLLAADQSAMQRTGSGFHGTSVAGVIGASGEGGMLGVAPEADLTSLPIFNRTVVQMAAQLENMAKFDVVNHSWGWKSGFYDGVTSAAWQAFHQTFEHAARTGRDGLGTVMVFASGNSGAMNADANASLMTSSRFAMAVGAVTDLGERASYTTGGASLFISAPSSGGRNGITTTDNAGRFGAQTGDVNNNFGGTSAAAPQVSGVVALMLEANPNLGWRDVQDILALSARQLDIAGSTSISSTANGATNWNGGGLRFSNDVGFGLVNATAAVRLAETWIAGNNSSNELAIDVVGTGPVQDQFISSWKSGSLTFSVGKGLEVEKIVVELDLTHDRASDLVVRLVSPDGTTSLLLDQSGYSRALPAWSFNSNAFRGELAEGIWTLVVEDRVQGGDGMLRGGTLHLYGSASTPDDVFVFTDDYAELVATDPSRGVMHDADGFDILNLAAVSGDVVIDLTAARASEIDGATVLFAQGTRIEALFAGDGDDHLTAHDQGCLILGGRGDDTILGGDANDYLEGGPGMDQINGGLGVDTAIYRFMRDQVRLDRVEDGWIVMTTDGQDFLTNVEVFAFQDGILTFDLVESEAVSAYRLYEATFGRNPDEAGLVNWARAAMTGGSLDGLDGSLGSVEPSLVRAEQFQNGVWLAGQDWLL